MTQPIFIEGGEITKTGAEVIAFLEGIVKPADEAKDVLTINSWGGYVSHYYTMVHKGQGKGFGMDAQTWLEQFPEGALNAHRAMTYLQEQAEKEVAQEEQVSGIEATLEAVQEKLEAQAELLKEQQHQIRGLKSRNTVLTNKLDELTVDEQEAEVVEEVTEEPEAEVEAEDVEAEDSEE